MNRLPKIGERVRYYSPARDYREARECFGTVRKHYPGYYEPTLRQRPVGSRGWNEHWSACVEVESPLPDWWGYSDNLFAPSIDELEPA